MESIQRYAEAASNGTDYSVIAAAGYCGEKWAMKLFRLKYANEAHQYKDVLAGLLELARPYAGSNLNNQQIVKITIKALKHWLFDTCPICLGKGHLPVQNTPMLDDKPCNACNGQGTVKWSGPDFGLTVISLIKSAESTAGGKLMRRIKENMDISLSS